MRSFLLALAGMACMYAPAAARATESGHDGLELKSVSAQQVLTIKVASLSGFPAAFEKLEEYCDRQQTFRPVLRMSLGSSQAYYAAVAFEGSPRESPDVKVIELPPAMVVTALHRGPYYQLPGSVKKLMEAAADAGYAPDESALLRLLHRDIPVPGVAETPVTEIQIPVVKRD